MIFVIGFVAVFIIAWLSYLTLHIIENTKVQNEFNADVADLLNKQTSHSAPKNFSEYN